MVCPPVLDPNRSNTAIIEFHTRIQSHIHVRNQQSNKNRKFNLTKNQRLEGKGRGRCLASGRTFKVDFRKIWERSEGDDGKGLFTDSSRSQRCSCFAF